NAQWLTIERVGAPLNLNKIQHGLHCCILLEVEDKTSNSHPPDLGGAPAAQIECFYCRYILAVGLSTPTLISVVWGDEEIEMGDRRGVLGPGCLDHKDPRRSSQARRGPNDPPGSVERRQAF
ncbi:hypothetical protein Dimus_000586, partial [Dionaea muscipula]